MIASVLIATILLAPAAGKPAPRTLDDIMIEGEVRLPQVVFITSREANRPLDWLDHYMPPGAAEVAAGAALATRIDVIPSEDPADETESPDAPAPPELPSEAEDSTKESHR
jgi:hypothetical protein